MKIGNMKQLIYYIMDFKKKLKGGYGTPIVPKFNE